ncbi:hypothetical protein L210DRAFT_933734 [Boletus edulis BED1]|uniref:Uncharacterized protein n=1 Tax=Boletus edulis BED1 TaxID=1328754 RepID=A0AAD4G737_BOLED|nr:hypothetical protein L210DRAFT_933734 [Boletus edulis BED1]
MATAEEVRNRLSDEYLNFVISEAMFYMNGDEPNFRFVTNRGWEFSVGVWIGPDPQGTLYYKDGVFQDGSKLPGGQETEASFEVLRVESRRNVPFAHIKFYAPNSTTELLGEFLARDPHEEAKHSGFLNSSPLPSGKWRSADSVKGHATVDKAGDSDKITIECTGLEVKIEITCNHNDIIYGEAIPKIGGTLTARNLSVLRNGDHVRWRHDHAVFHDGENAMDFTSFFMRKHSLVEHINFISLGASLRGFSLAPIRLRRERKQMDWSLLP